MDIRLLRDPETLAKVKASQRARYDSVALVDVVVALDSALRSIRNAAENEAAEINKAQKQIGMLFKEKKIAEGKEKSAALAVRKQILEKDKKEVAALERARDEKLLLLGNLVHESVPVSDDEELNRVERTWGTAKERTEWMLHHSDVMTRLHAYAMGPGSAVAGHRGFFLHGAGTLINQALIQFGIAFLRKEGYDPLQTPLFMKQDMMGMTAQLADYDEQLYRLDNGEHEDAYLIATSEQPISCYHANTWMDPKQLPLRYAGVSTCFRKEAGSSGRDLRGIFRVHQFEKVEQFVITDPDKSWEEHDRMLDVSERFLQALGLPYRVVTIVSGELNDAAAKKYDVEGWFPETGEYRELVSCSNCTDYQSRKLGIRFGQSKTEGEAVRFVHMLNSTLCATERTMCCIMENYQTETGFIVPEALRPYCHGIEEFPYTHELPPPPKAASKGKGKGKGKKGGKQ